MGSANVTPRTFNSTTFIKRKTGRKTIAAHTRLLAIPLTSCFASIVTVVLS
jgi:hypothetical protein